MADDAPQDRSQLMRDLRKENHIRSGIEVLCEKLQYELTNALAERDMLRRENESLRARLASIGRLALSGQSYPARLSGRDFEVSRMADETTCTEHRVYHKDENQSLLATQDRAAPFARVGAERSVESDIFDSPHPPQHGVTLRIEAWRRFHIGIRFRRKMLLMRAYNRNLKDQAYVFLYTSWRRFILAKTSRQTSHDLLRSYCVELKFELKKTLEQLQRHHRIVQKHFAGKICQTLLVRKYDNLHEDYQKLRQQWKQLRSCSTQATLANNGSADFEVPPGCWGIRMQQLVDLQDEIYDDFHQYCGCHSIYRRGRDWVHVCNQWPCRYGDHEGAEHQSICNMPEAEKDSLRPMKPDMQVLVDRYIKPKTKHSRRSYALTVNPTGAEVSVFVTHSRHDLFDNVVSTLRWAVPSETVLWVGSFAINQHSTGEVEDMLSAQDLDQAPFAQALRCSVKQLVVVDEELNLVSQAWCLFQIARAFAWGIPTHLRSRRRSTLVELSSRILSVDITKVHATEQMDSDRIFATIQESGGVDALNAHIRRCIHDKVQMILEQGDGSLWSADLRKVDVLSESLLEATDESERDKLRMMIKDVANYDILDDDKVAKLLNAKVREQTDRELKYIVSQLRDIEVKKASITDQSLLLEVEKEQSRIEFQMRTVEMRKLANVKESFLLHRVEDMATKVNELGASVGLPTR